MIIINALKVQISHVAIVESSVSSGSEVLSCQPLRSAASASQLPVSMPVSFRSRLETSLKRNAGRRPVASSLYRRSLGIRPFSIRRTCPSQRSRRLQSMRCTLRKPAFSNTAALATLSVLPGRSPVGRTLSRTHCRTAGC